MKEEIKAGLWAAACVLLIALDRLTKAWAVRALAGRGATAVWPGVFHFRYAENTGAAFGLFGGFRWVNVLLTFAFVLVAGAMILRHREKPGVLPFGALLMAGGLSHLYDRLFGRCIVDFIEVEFMRFAIFNVADICICVGAIGLTCACLWQENRVRSKEQ